MIVKDPRISIDIEKQPTKPMPLAELSPRTAEPATGPLLSSLRPGPAATLVVLKRCNRCQHLEPVAASYCGSCGLLLMV